MLGRGWDRLGSYWGPQRGMQKSHWWASTCPQATEGWLLLADPDKRQCWLRQNMWQIPKAFQPPPHVSRDSPFRHVPLALLPVRRGYPASFPHSVGFAEVFDRRWNTSKNGQRLKSRPKSQGCFVSTRSDSFACSVCQGVLSQIIKPSLPALSW